jgi:hypothetical protein
MDKQNTHNGKLFTFKKEGNPVTHVTTWMNLEDITLSELSQSYKKRP